MVEAPICRSKESALIKFMAATASILISLVIAFVASSLYQPVASTGPSLLRAYRNAGCVIKPDFIAETADMWKDGAYVQMNFDKAWRRYLNGGTLILFCPKEVK